MGAATGLYRRRRLRNQIVIGLSFGATAIGLGWLAIILGTLLWEGASGLSLKVFTEMTPPPGSDGGLLNPIAGSLIMTGLGVLIGTPVGILAGTYMAEYGRYDMLTSIVRFINDILLSAPSIVVGLFIYLLLSRSGPLGVLGLLFSPGAMIVAQAVLVLPIIAALTRQIVEDLWEEYGDQLRSLGSTPFGSIGTLLWEGRITLLTALLAGFGRASAEVGAVMIVGGNIDQVTRVMTTTIALETSKGDLPLALSLGIVLITLVLALNAAAYGLKEAAQRRYG